jgi:CRP-like cAMP-binding protein
MQPTNNPSQNQLLAALPKEELNRFLPNLELVQIRLGDRLYEPNEQMRHAYFPTTSIMSLHYVAESGASTETAAVGKEGMVGISLFMGGNTTPSSALVRTAGFAYRLERQILKEEFNRGAFFQRLLLRYTQSLMTQIFQTAACNRHHSVEQQLCSWLLFTIDRVQEKELVITQEFVASMLGVRRESVTDAAGKLQTAGCISYRRGHISVLNREVLESRVCECYTVVKKETNRLMCKVN